jgi:hypothetical protein
MQLCLHAAPNLQTPACQAGCSGRKCSWDGGQGGQGTHLQGEESFDASQPQHNATHDEHATEQTRLLRELRVAAAHHVHVAAGAGRGDFLAASGFRRRLRGFLLPRPAGQQQHMLCTATCSRADLVLLPGARLVMVKSAGAECAGSLAEAGLSGEP